MSDTSVERKWPLVFRFGETVSIPAYIKSLSERPGSIWREYFGQRDAYPGELPSIMVKHIYTGAMGSIYFALITGIFFVYFGNAIGMSPFGWSLMGGVSSFLLAVQIVSARITQLLGHRKMLWFLCALTSRVVRLAGILVALWLWHGGSAHGCIVLIGAVWVAAFFEALATPAWMSWLADIIPEHEQGGFWGRRAAWIGAAIICVVVPAGLLMDRVPEARRLHTAVAIFIVAGVLGIADLVIHGTLPEPAMAAGEEGSFFTQLLAPLRDRGFRPWLAFSMVWWFGVTLGGSLAVLFFMDNLRIKENLLGGQLALTAVWLVGSILTASWSGKLVDRVGPRRVLFWGHLFWSLLPAFWIFATPRTALVWLGMGSLVGGTSLTAADTASTKLITRYPQPADRAMYLAVWSCLGSLAGGAGMLAAGAVLKALHNWTWAFMGWTFVAFHVLFVASVVLRLASVGIFLHRVKDPGEQA